MHSLSKPELVVSWICRVVAAIILLQTLFFKFTGAPESVYIFTKVGLEPWGRIGSGVVELEAALRTGVLVVVFPEGTSSEWAQCAPLQTVTARTSSADELRAHPSSPQLRVGRRLRRNRRLLLGRHDPAPAPAESLPKTPHIRSRHLCSRMSEHLRPQGAGFGAATRDPGTIRSRPEQARKSLNQGSREEEDTSSPTRSRVSITFEAPSVQHFDFPISAPASPASPKVPALRRRRLRESRLRASRRNRPVPVHVADRGP